MAQNNSQTYKIELNNSKEIYDYCLLNQIIDINGFIQKCFKKGFDIEKYGLLSTNESTEPEIQVIERIVEVVKEVQLPPIVKEVIKYIDREVVKEVPVETIVEKIVKIYDNSESKEQEKRIKFLESELERYSSIPEEPIKTVQNNQDEKLKLLQGTLLNLKKQLSLKDEEIKQKEEIIKQLESLKVGPNGAVFLKSSDITKNI